jgi:hypothetical protein
VKINLILEHISVIALSLPRHRLFFGQHDIFVCGLLFVSSIISDPSEGTCEDSAERLRGQFGCVQRAVSVLRRVRDRCGPILQTSCGWPCHLPALPGMPWRDGWINWHSIQLLLLCRLNGWLAEFLFVGRRTGDRERD